MLLDVEAGQREGLTGMIVTGWTKAGENNEPARSASALKRLIS